MSKTREKKVLITKPITNEDAEQEFANFAAADAKLQKINAEMDVKITAIREKYQDEIARLNEVKEQAFEKLQHFAINAPELFVKRRSIEMTHGVLGFRTGTPKLKLVKGFTWAKVLDNLKHYLPTYVRVVEEPAKDRLLSDREVPEVKENLTKVGCLVDQDETFFVEPKKEAVTA